MAGGSLTSEHRSSCALVHVLSCQHGFAHSHAQSTGWLGKADMRQCIQELFAGGKKTEANVKALLEALDAEEPRQHVNYAHILGV